MYEMLLLLLPVAAASGWWAARRSANAAKEACRERDPAYFRGLNYLLDEQPDKAIDVFIKLLDVDSDTVETHLALGNLFRRRGEADRAIRIHQNLIARPSLSREQRGLALLELGQDYMRAGLFDRAESLFEELVDTGMHREKALGNLKEIYQQEKDWDRCLEVVGALEKVSGQPHGTEIAHYYCEQAEEALRAGDTRHAGQLTRKALEVDGRCVRATLLQAGMDRARNDLEAAVRSYRRVGEQDPEFVPEILPRLIECHEQLRSTHELTDFLLRLYRERADTRLMLAVADILEREGADTDAQQLVRAHLQQHADLLALQRFIALKRPGDPGDGEHQATFDLVYQTVGRLLERHPSYQCARCGFVARRVHWQCPGCKGWGSVRPVPADGPDLR
jgi:lipopolysaccharide biosynthesis regulator YciM